MAPRFEARKPQQQLDPQLRSYALNWADSRVGLGRDTVREATRVEYRRLLSTFALSYFPAEIKVGDLTRSDLQGFVSWLRSRPGPRGRLSERSIRNAVTPLRLCLRCAKEEGLIGDDAVRALALPRRRNRGARQIPEGRFLTPRAAAGIVFFSPADQETTTFRGAMSNVIRKGGEEPVHRPGAQWLVGPEVIRSLSPSRVPGKLHPSSLR